MPIATPSAVTHVETEEDNAVIYPLGAARAQVHDTFIIAETENSLVIVDQHAAHERLVYERLKRAFAGGLSRQMLLIPEVVELDAEAAGRLVAAAEELDVSAARLRASAHPRWSCAKFLHCLARPISRG